MAKQQMISLEWPWKMGKRTFESYEQLPNCLMDICTRAKKQTHEPSLHILLHQTTHQQKSSLQNQIARKATTFSQHIPTVQCTQIIMQSN